jgi:hypothetical protein
MKVAGVPPPAFYNSTLAVLAGSGLIVPIFIVLVEKTDII